jgi:hypothetical protein
MGENMNKYELLAYLPAFLLFGIWTVYMIYSGGINTLLIFLICGILFILAILWTRYWMNKSMEKR